MTQTERSAACAEQRPYTAASILPAHMQMFQNSDGKLYYSGQNAHVLWPGPMKPGLWMVRQAEHTHTQRKERTLTHSSHTHERTPKLCAVGGERSIEAYVLYPASRNWCTCMRACCPFPACSTGAMHTRARTHKQTCTHTAALGHGVSQINKACHAESAAACFAGTC